jgi:hypothetical protein
MITLHPITKRILWGFGGFCAFMVLMIWRTYLSSMWMRAMLATCAFGIFVFSLLRDRKNKS